MDNETIINLDNVTISRSADDTVTITSKKGGSCLTMGLLIATAFVALAGGVVTIMGILQKSGAVLFGLVMAVMFGLFTYYLYRRMRTGQEMKAVFIMPILNTVKIGGRAIPFNNIVDIATREAPIPLLEGAVAIQFGLALTNGEIVELGRKAMDSGSWEKVEKLTTETLALLKGAIKRN